MRALRMYLSRSLQPSSHSHSHSSGALTLAHPHHSLSPYKRSSMVATPHGLICSTTPGKKSLKHRRVKDMEPEKGRPGLQPQPVRFLSQCSETSVPGTAKCIWGAAISGLSSCPPSPDPGDLAGWRRGAPLWSDMEVHRK